MICHDMYSKNIPDNSILKDLRNQGLKDLGQPLQVGINNCLILHKALLYASYHSRKEKNLKNRRNREIKRTTKYCKRKTHTESTSRLLKLS